MVHFTLNLEDIREKFKEDLKVPLPYDLTKEIEFEFHTADYHTLDEVCTGLKVTAGFIIKVSNNLRSECVYHIPDICDRICKNPACHKNGKSRNVHF